MCCVETNDNSFDHESDTLLRFELKFTLFNLTGNLNEAMRGLEEMAQALRGFLDIINHALNRFQVLIKFVLISCY